MKWTVVYLPAAEKELTELWIDSSAREGVTDASNRIDQEPELDVKFPSRRYGGAYFGIHTRTSDSSFSTSRGLAI